MCIAFHDIGEYVAGVKELRPAARDEAAGLRFLLILFIENVHGHMRILELLTDPFIVNWKIPLLGFRLLPKSLLQGILAHVTPQSGEKACRCRLADCVPDCETLVPVSLSICDLFFPAW